MKIFLRAQFSSIIATAVDFLVFTFFVEFTNVHYTLGVLAGAITGALTNFMVNRNWAFNVQGKSIKEQSLRYLLVWTGSVLLNVSGLYLMTDLFKIKYVLLSKIIVSISVGLSFNYLLQKKYVFTVK